LVLRGHRVVEKVGVKGALELQERQVQQDLQGQTVSQEKTVSREQKVTQEALDHLDSQVPPDQQVTKVISARQDHQAQVEKVEVVQELRELQE